MENLLIFNDVGHKGEKMNIKKIMVTGSGFMGSGIAQVAAAAGFTVIMQDIKDELVQKGLSTIKKNLRKGEVFFT